MTKTLKRRRKEAKTDYKARLALLKSEKPRIVIRKTNKYIMAQIIKSDHAQDKVIASATSKDLLKKGWPDNKNGSLKTLAACYLTGSLLVKNLKDKPEEVILDIGLSRNVHGSRIYALLKGAIDSGLNVSHKKEILPSLEKINSTNKSSIVLAKIKEGI
ncbi:MAG: 50S ribosomal protein L18 [Nanoarchaeota archaeon]